MRNKSSREVAVDIEDTLDGRKLTRIQRDGYASDKL